MPHNLPHAQSVRCHLLVGGHAFAFDAQFIPVLRVASEDGGTIGPFNGRAANSIPLSHEA